MELRQLRQFLAVAEEGNFTRAAQRCHIVQSALSTSIRMLEDELGTKLFVRSTRQVSLTEAGAVFWENTRRAIDIIDQAKARVGDVIDMRTGRLAIGTVQGLPAFLDLPALLARFHRAHPGIEVRLVQGGASELNEKVASRELDLAILPIEEANEKLGSHVMTCDDMVLASSREHALAACKSVSLKQLANEAFIDFEKGKGTRRLVDRGFDEAGLQRSVQFEVSDLDTLLQLVEQGLGIALLPSIVVRRSDALAFVAIQGEPLCWELVVSYPPGDAKGNDHSLDPAPAAFLELLVLEAQSLCLPD